MIVDLCPVSPNHHPRISDGVVNMGHLVWSSLKRNSGQSIALAGLGMNTRITMPSIVLGDWLREGPWGE